MSNVLDNFINRLTDNYNKEPGSNVYKMLQLTAKHIQENEDTLTVIDDSRDIDKAQGKTLDKHGKNVNQDRGQAPDELFRVLIKSKIKRSLSNGSVDTIIDLLAFILNLPYSSIKITENPSGKKATIAIDVPGSAVNTTGLSFNQFGQFVNKVVAAGVKAEIASQGTFAFSSDYYNSQTDVTTGAADGLGNGGTLGQFYDPATDVSIPL